MNCYLISCNSTTIKERHENKDTHTHIIGWKKKRKLWNLELKKSMYYNESYYRKQQKFNWWNENENIKLNTFLLLKEKEKKKK